MIKKILLTSLFLLLVPLTAHLQTSPEQVSNFDASISIYADSSVLVKETIIYDFGSAQKHGIYRNIPYAYNRNGSKYNIRLNVETVKDESGQLYDYSQSRSGGYLKLKIGDSQTYVTGKKTYVISYTVNRAINFFTDQDEFFWNVTGNEWEVPIQSASA